MINTRDQGLVKALDGQKKAGASLSLEHLSHLPEELLALRLLGRALQWRSFCLSTSRQLERGKDCAAEMPKREGVPGSSLLPLQVARNNGTQFTNRT